MDLAESDRRNIWHPYTPLVDSDPPLVIESASGLYLTTSDGRKIMDAISSWWVNLHGHSHPHIARAIGQQAEKMEHVIFAGFSHEPAIRLAENLLDILPENQARVFFSDNGSTAVEVAIKMAIQYWRNVGQPKKRIVALEGAYHGDTFGAMSVSERGIFNAAFRDHLFEVIAIPFPKQGTEESTVDAFRTATGQRDVAAFIFEPLLQGAAGMRMYAHTVLDTLIEIARDHGVLCIADEILTGFGRTGRLFASDYLRNRPDIITLSKGITGGALPLGATTCTEEIVEAFRSAEIGKTFFHGHSYTANPMACAAANASFELLTDPDCKRRIEKIGDAHTAFVSRIKQHPRLRDARALGTVLAVEIDTGKSSSYGDPVRKKIYRFFLERNILMRPLGNVVYVLPPYIMTGQELDVIYASIEELLDKL